MKPWMKSLAAKFKPPEVVDCTPEEAAAMAKIRPQVIALQRRHGLPVTGYIDLATENALKQELRTAGRHDLADACPANGLPETE